MEAHKYPVLCSGRVGGSRMAFPIPKTGDNKNSGKKGPSYGPFYYCSFYNRKKDLLEESLEIM